MQLHRNHSSMPSLLQQQSLHSQASELQRKSDKRRIAKRREREREGERSERRSNSRRDRKVTEWERERVRERKQREGDDMFPHPTALLMETPAQSSFSPHSQRRHVTSHLRHGHIHFTWQTPWKVLELHSLEVITVSKTLKNYTTLLLTQLKAHKCKRKRQRRSEQQQSAQWEC